LGVSGTITSQILKTVSGITTNTVIVEGGINNLVFGSGDQIILNYTYILQAIPSTKKVIVVGIIPIDEAQLRISRPTDTETNAQIAAINAQLVALCKSFPNCTPALQVMSKSMTGLTVDGIHLTGAAAYQELLASLPSL
jgi:lysophospholipase L1-like esterase